MFKDFNEGNFVPITKRRIRLDACKKYGLRAFKNAQDDKFMLADYYNTKGIAAQHIYHVSHWEKRFTWKGSPRECKLFGQQLWPGGGKRLVIAKGELDTLTIADAFGLKWPVVGVPGFTGVTGWIKRNYEWIDSYKDIILAFDTTEAGLVAIEEVATLFVPGKVRVMTYDHYTDANEMLMENAGAKVAPQVFNAKEYRPDGIVYGDELWEDIIAPPPIGYEIPYPVLNDKLKGVRKGRIYLLAAGSGLGKSTLAHEIANHLFIIHKQKVGTIGLEEPRKRLAERYLAIKLNKQIHINRDEISDEELKQAYDATINNKNFCIYDHRGSKDIKSLLSKIRYMTVGLGMEWIVLDHISIVVSGIEEINESERKTIDRLMTGLSTMVEELSFGLIAVVHLKRKDKGKGYNEGRPVTLSDLRGSGSLEQLSHVVIALERDQQTEEIKNYSQLRLVKDRDLGDTGKADVLKYDVDTGRLEQSDINPFEKDCPFEEEGRGDF